MKKEKPLLTIIVPAYNVEKYIEDCLLSLLNQTMVDHKIVVVNDGSTDKTGEIVKKIAIQYPDTLRYVEQENQGLGAARNTGLVFADTEYVTFLDSDDWWNCHFIKKFKNELSRHDERPDIIFTLPWIYDEISKRCIPWNDKILLERVFYPNGGHEDVVSKEVNIKIDRRLYELEASACRRIYRTDFLKRIKFQFPVGVKWEDVQPHFYSIHHAKLCIGLKSTGFIYRINSGGQITSGGGASRLDIITVFQNTIQMAESEEWPEEEIAYILRMLWNFSTWSISVTNTEYIDPLLQGLHNLFRTIPKKYFKVYFRLCFPNKRKEKIMTMIIRSPFYRIMRDYRIRQFGQNVIVKMWHIQNRFRRK